MTNLTNNKAVLSWIDEMTAITKPDNIVWITGEEEQLDALREQGEHIGIATVYRQLEKLERQGSVHKVTTDEGAYYQFCTHGCASDCCLFKCERCGRIVHLDCHQLSPLYEHLEREHGFSINPRKTMFYGLCRECQEGA